MFAEQTFRNFGALQEIVNIPCIVALLNFYCEIENCAQAKIAANTDLNMVNLYTKPSLDTYSTIYCNIPFICLSHCARQLGFVCLH